MFYTNVELGSMLGSILDVHSQPLDQVDPYRPLRRWMCKYTPKGAHLYTKHSSAIQVHSRKLSLSLYFLSLSSLRV